jgi:hypothetical protein
MFRQCFARKINIFFEIARHGTIFKKNKFFSARAAESRGKKTRGCANADFLRMKELNSERAQIAFLFLARWLICSPMDDIFVSFTRKEAHHFE